VFPNPKTLNPKTFMKFELIDHEYIQLNQLLKLLGLVDTGGEANQRIVDGEVTVNQVVEYQKRKKLRAGDVILFNKKEITIK
jgi:ribosome-associated protein